MSENINCIEELTKLVSIVGAFELSVAANNQYKKTNRKNKLKLIKLNSNNY